MELRQLRYFVAVAEELHFRRAAERLHMSQPPLSQQIRKLEEELGVELLRRAHRRVELTDVGRVFLLEARRTLAHAERALGSARSAGRGELGWLRVGFVGSVAYELLPRLLREFRRHYGGVQLELRELTTEEQIEALESGDIDLGLARDLEPRNGVTVTPLFSERLLAALPASHRFAQKEKVTLAELADDAFVVVPRDRVPRLYDRFVYLCRAANFDPTISQEALQFATILGLVSAEIGISIVPEVVKEFRKEGVAFVPLTDSEATSEVSLVHVSERSSPTLATFMQTAHQVFSVTESNAAEPTSM